MSKCSCGVELFDVDKKAFEWDLDNNNVLVAIYRCPRCFHTLKVKL